MEKEKQNKKSKTYNKHKLYDADSFQKTEQEYVVKNGTEQRHVFDFFFINFTSFKKFMLDNLCMH